MPSRPGPISARVMHYRRLHPRSRAVDQFKYCRNSSSVKQECCIFCGERGPTYSAKWPKTATAYTWNSEHVDSCSEAPSYDG